MYCSTLQRQTDGSNYIGAAKLMLPTTDESIIYQYRLVTYEYMLCMFLFLF